MIVTRIINRPSPPPLPFFLLVFPALWIQQHDPTLPPTDPTNTPYLTGCLRLTPPKISSTSYETPSSDNHTTHNNTTIHTHYSQLTLTFCTPTIESELCNNTKHT